MKCKKMSSRFNISKRLLTFISILVLTGFLCISQASAGRLDGSSSLYQSRIIDHSITPQRVAIVEGRIDKSGGTDQASINKMKAFSKKTVFWRGRVEKFLAYEKNFWILIHHESGRYFWVFAKKSIRNLDFDRSGWIIGVKGTMVLKNDKLLYLKAKSIVLIEPSEALEFHEFKNKYHVSSAFTMKTSTGVVNMSNRYYPFILHRVYIHNPHYDWSRIQEIGKALIYYCHQNNVDPLLATAMLNIESAFDSDAVSSSGAIGLGQLMPGTASGLGVDPHNVTQNVGGAVKYLGRQLKRWQGYTNQVEMALASYNAGPGAVARYGGVPPYSETKNYVFFITMMRDEYKKQFDRTPSKVSGMRNVKNQ